MIINFDALKATDPGLYTIITNRVGLAFIGQYEFQPVEFAALTPAIRRRLSEWAVLHPATTVIDKPVPPPRDYAAEDRAALKQDIQRTTDESRGLARLRQFQTEQGLRDCKENADAI